MSRIGDNDILFSFGTLLVVLIAIEIFVNITLYLKEDVIHVKLVIATFSTRDKRNNKTAAFH